MRGRSRNERLALAQYLARIRQVIQTVAVVEVRSSGSTLNTQQSIMFLVHGGQAGNAIPVRQRDGRRDLAIGVYCQFVMRDALDESLGVRIEVTRYLYELLDRSGREIFAYHWHPEGISPIRTPHLHVSGAAPIVLNADLPLLQSRRLDLSSAHFATGPITLDTFVALLIRDFEVQPLHDDWEQRLS